MPGRIVQFHISLCCHVLQRCCKLTFRVKRIRIRIRRIVKIFLDHGRTSYDFTLAICLIHHDHIVTIDLILGIFLRKLRIDHRILLDDLDLTETVVLIQNLLDHYIFAAILTHIIHLDRIFDTACEFF